MACLLAILSIEYVEFQPPAKAMPARTSPIA
jgi:hypothetical protein